MTTPVRTLTLTLMLATLPSIAQAVPINHDIVWSGSNGYSMTGAFSYDDAAAIDGMVIDGEVDSLMIEVFQNGLSLGATDVDTTLANFSFNFDVLNSTLPPRTVPDGNQWNFRQSTGVGFSYGGNASAVSVGRSFLGFTFHGSPDAQLSVTPTGTVPLPNTAWLLGAGLLGMVPLRRRLRERASTALA